MGIAYCVRSIGAIEYFGDVECFGTGKKTGADPSRYSDCVRFTSHARKQNLTCCTRCTSRFALSTRTHLFITLTGYNERCPEAPSAYHMAVQIIVWLHTLNAVA